MASSGRRCHWAEEYKAKLLPSVSDAAALVKAGDYVVFAGGGAAATAIASALAERREELSGTIIESSVNTFGEYPWYQPDWGESFRLRSGHLRPPDRAAHDRKQLEFFPVSIGVYLKHMRENNLGQSRRSDFYMVAVSPPDEKGFCCFGPSLWFTHSFTREARSRTIIAQVDPAVPVVYGDTLIHVSDIDWFVEAPQGLQEQVLYPADEQELRAIEAISDQVASLIKDRDCLFIGGGGVSYRLVGKLGNRQDLGYHSEIMLYGMPKLVEGGVFTGKYKTSNPNKAVAAELHCAPEEVETVAGNPAFEFYGLEYVDSAMVIASNDNTVAVNTSMAVDLSGQIASESMGTRQYTGSGGQLDGHFGALMSRGGRAITVLTSTFKDRTGQSGSRIVPALDKAVPITVPRSLSQWIVTEYGMVNLMGKSQRERAEALISIAHPDFRAELHQEFSRLPWW